jgi:hypothetical protein
VRCPERPPERLALVVVARYQQQAMSSSARIAAEFVLLGATVIGEIARGEHHPAATASH